ncbi:MAG TPA: acyltransferase [Acetobacteraceae bacterium]|nr:acyltransferase [Acetobacteraceae bacterium]
MPVPTLHDVARGRNNNFNLLRMVAASAVLISHAYPIAEGVGSTEPLERALGMSLGTLAVMTFFVISGFFISYSFAERHSLLGFVVARLLRLYPGLLLALVITTLLLGPLYTHLSVQEYFLDARSMSYVPRNLSLKWLQYDLPGVFQNNRYPEVINGSLWSLFYEVACYALVVFVGLVGLTQRHRRFCVFIGVYAAGYLLWRLGRPSESLLIANAFRLSLPFVLGMAYCQFRRFIPFHFGVCLVMIGLSVMTYGTGCFPEVFLLSWSYFIFFVGYWQSRIFGKYNLVGDYSYGMYIYAFPCEQILAGTLKDIRALSLIALSFPLTLVCATLSWHLLERRALRCRQTIECWLIYRLYGEVR